MSKQPFQQLLNASTLNSTSNTNHLARSSISSQYQNAYETAETIVMNINPKTERHQDTPRMPLPSPVGKLATFCKDVDCKTTSQETLEVVRNEKIVSLTMQVERLKSCMAGMARLKQQNSVLMTRCQELEQQRDSVYSRILQVQKQMTEDIRRRQEKLEEAYRRIKNIHESNLALQQEVASSKSQQLQIRLQANQELIQCRAKLTVLETEARNKCNQQKNFDQAISQHQANSKLVLSSLVNNWLKQRQELEGRLADQHESHQRELLSKDDQIRDLKFQTSKLRNELSTVQNRDCEQESLLAERETLMKEHQRQYEQELQRLHQLFRQKQNSFDSERKSLLANISASRAQKERLERQLRELEAVNTHLQEKLRQSTIGSSTTRQQVQQLQQALLEQEKKHSNSELIIGELTQEKLQLAASIDGLRSQLQAEFKRKLDQAQAQRAEYSISMGEIQYEVELERKKARKLEQQLSAYAQQSAVYLKAEIENKMLREEVQKLYQSTLDLQEKLRQEENRGQLCDITFTNRQLIDEIGERRESSALRRTQSQKRGFSLDRRRDNQEKENRYISNPPSVERTPLAVRQNSVTRLDTYGTATTPTPSQNNQTAQRMPSDFIDPFVCDDGNMLRNKLSEKNLLPQPAKQKIQRGSYANRNSLFERQKMNESILKRCQQLLQANRLARM